MHVIAWDALSVVEPTAAEVAVAAPALAAAYNDPRNATLLGHTSELTAGDVVEHYARLAAAGAHGFLLYEHGVLAGDADLRDVEDGTAEFAFLICAPSTQGKGLGTRFATMIHAFAFTTLGLARIYASVIPQNAASLRVFEKLGYVRDTTTDRGDAGDIVLRADRECFVRDHAAALAAIRIAVR